MNLTNLFLLLRRLLAFLYDSFLLIALFFAVTTVALFLNQGEAIESIVFKLMLIPVAGLFYIWFWIHGGQTLGMRAWRIKLVNNDQSSLTWQRCLAHFIGGLLLFGITYLYIPFNKRGLAMHDALAKTRIVIEKSIK